MSAKSKNKKFTPSVAQIVFISFAAIILFGALLLQLPFCHKGPSHAFIDDLFTSTSAVCVTGLMTLDLGADYTELGMLVIMFLIQLGGLGYMTLFSLAMVLVGKKLSLREQLNLKDATDQPGMSGLVAFVRNVATYMLVAEVIGSCLLATQTIPEFGLSEGAFKAIFFSVCAPNNAGFSMYSDGLARWQGNPVFLLTLSGLIIFGGLGFNVIQTLVAKVRNIRINRWHALVNIVLSWTVALLVISTILIWVLERTNEKTLAPMPFWQQWLNAFFMAVQPRTSGFNSVDTGAMTPASLSAMVGLMFLGTGPGGTGGGIKLTTAAILLAVSSAVLRGQEQVLLPGLKRAVSDGLIKKALAVTILSAVVVCIGTFIMACFEDIGVFSLLFEAVSAFATAGLSVGVSSKVGLVGKIVLTFLMFAGRVGVLVLINAFWSSSKRSAVRYPEENLLVG